MWLFPYHRFCIISTNSKQIAIANLSENINPKPDGGFFKRIYSSNASNKYFDGKLLGSLFKIHRRIEGRNSFIPMIKGTIERYDQQSKIMIRMRLHPVILVFCSWIFIVSSFYNSTINSIKFNFNLTGLIISLVIYVFALISFLHEANVDKKVLLDIFEGEIEG